MVYSKLYIVIGTVLTREEILKSGMLELIDDNISDEMLDDENWRIDSNGRGFILKLYRFPCCSKSTEKLYILGRRLYSYVRYHIRCEKCSKYSLCDTCIGSTRNGIYDVGKILHTPTECPRENVCMHCYNDNRKEFDTCKECNSRKNWNNRFDHGQEEKMENMYEYEMIQKVLKDADVENYKDKHIGFYYMLDDCLSCT
jgi:hypothetical protein